MVGRSFMKNSLVWLFWSCYSGYFEKIPKSLPEGTAPFKGNTRGGNLSILLLAE